MLKAKKSTTKKRSAGFEMFGNLKSLSKNNLYRQKIIKHERKTVEKVCKNIL